MCLWHLIGGVIGHRVFQGKAAQDEVWDVIAKADHAVAAAIISTIMVTAPPVTAVVVAAFGTVFSAAVVVAARLFCTRRFSARLFAALGTLGTAAVFAALVFAVIPARFAAAVAPTFAPTFTHRRCGFRSLGHHDQYRFSGHRLQRRHFAMRLDRTIPLFTATFTGARATGFGAGAVGLV